MPAPKGNNFAIGNKGGRPTKYSPDMVVQVKEYLDSCKDQYDENGKLASISLPTMAGLSLWLNVNKTTLYDWGKDNKEFSHALDEVMQEQEKRILNNSLIGKYNPVISKLILSAKHEYREQSDITTKGSEINNLNVHFINAKDGNN